MSVMDRSNPCVPLIAAVFPETAIAAPQTGKAVDDLNAHDVFGLLVAELPFDPQTQGAPCPTDRSFPFIS